jgi:CheY-like chemotaxis protein
MTDPSSDKNFTTRHLKPEKTSAQPARPGTGPLDYAMPWIIELRVVGTPSVLQVQVRELISVGRADKDRGINPDIDLDPFRGYQLGVSRRHAVISARNSRVTLMDKGSSNGTFINGAQLEPEQEYRVRHGDTIAFGRLALQVFFVVTPSSHEKNHMPYNEVIIPIIASDQTVLVVEDDEKVANAIGSVLEQAGFSYVWKGSVIDAMTYINTALPSIIILELMLPDRSGLEVVQFVRSRPEGASIPLMVVTSATGGYQMGQAIEAGVDVFLTKPVGIDELLTGLSKVVAEI